MYICLPMNLMYVRTYILLYSEHTHVCTHDRNDYVCKYVPVLGIYQRGRMYGILMLFVPANSCLFDFAFEWKKVHTYVRILWSAAN